MNTIAGSLPRITAPPSRAASPPVGSEPKDVLETRSRGDEALLAMLQARNRAGASAMERMTNRINTAADMVGVLFWGAVGAVAGGVAGVVAGSLAGGPVGAAVLGPAGAVGGAVGLGKLYAEGQGDNMGRILMAGSAIGAGALFGSFGGPVGTAIGAGMGALYGVGGAYMAWNS